MAGETPSVCAHEWLGAVAGYIPKKRSALLMTDFRPIACICTKYSLLLSIVADRTSHAAEDYNLLDDAQEGFRRNRNTKRQLGKLHSMFAEQRRRKQGLSVVLYLDIKNAFNAVNHRAIYHILEAKGFPAADIALFRRLYTGAFLVMSNQFGQSAACKLSRGMPQGAPPSPVVFSLVIDLIHSIVRNSKRGCTLQGSIAPTGSSGFADDSPLHTDGFDAVPAMAILVPKVAAYVEWAGMEINMAKSPVTAMDMQTGQRVATDSITLRGVPFPVVPPNQSHKHLGLRMALNGDFSDEKDHVRKEMLERLTALAEDRVISRKEKEVIIKTAICTVFSYSAGFVDWTNTELESITRMWIKAYKQAWTLPCSMDSSPIILDQSDGGRGCPLATNLWIREALDVLEQCISLPGEISRIVLRHLTKQCNAHGCHTLNQLQLLLRVGRADTVLELLLTRLDEQGLEISSPWAVKDEECIVDALWPRIHKAWLEKERWNGCTEVLEEVRAEWVQAQLCLKACGKLGDSAMAILSTVQLRGESGNRTRWMRLDELISRKCHLTMSEYTALTSWLPAPTASWVREEADSLEELAAGEASISCRGHEDECYPPNKRRRYDLLPLTETRAEATASVHCPQCIRGQISDTLQHNHLVLQYSPPADLPETIISKISDPQLLAYLCHGRAVFPYPCNDNDTLMVECLMPLRTVVSPYPFKQEYMIARLFAVDDTTPLTILQMALVRDCLIGADRERLKDACARPSWTVAQDEFYAGHYFTGSRECGTAPSWKLQAANSTGQLELTGLVLCITQRRHGIVPRPTVILHPWQMEPPLPSRITIDISHHLPRSLPAPAGWEILQRNGRVWLTEHSNGIVRLDAAHYNMLLAAGCDQAEQVPTAQFLVTLSESCRAQQDADRRHFVHWSRHLLADIKQITRTELLIGASAVMFNPHFLHFASPHPPDVHLGAVVDWPQLPALLVLDSFAPQHRGQMLDRAATHCPGVWVLWQHKNPDDPSLKTLRRTAKLYAELPKKSRVLHKTECWETAAWDVELSRSVSQLWRLNTDPKSVHGGPVPSPATVQHHLGGGGHHRYAFHWSMDPVPPRLLLHRQNQQDALRHNWDGLVAGTDGSVDERAERMGAAYVLGAGPDPIAIFFASVGGPLASARAEAASLLQLLRDVRGRYGLHVHLLIFVDCLVILDILRKWGRSEFHPDPKEIIHFTVIYPLIEELRQWTGNITLLKVKSHTGCLLNERADELAELGRTAEGPEICPGPQKYGSLWLRVRPEIRGFAAECGKTLPRDSAPNRSILEKVAGSNVLRAVRKRTTVFVSDLFDREEGSTVSKVIWHCTPSEYRVWLKCMTGIYPVQVYLKRIGKAQSPICPHCCSGTIESLTHFACVCPKFREARTSAHNQVRDVITSFLESALDTEWTLFEETRMANTGLTLRPTPQFTAEQWGRRQPDWVLVSQHHKRIAVVDLCRPSDVHPAQLLAAAMRKQQTYLPLLEALSYYSEQGWTIHVFPWVVGIRGMINPLHVHSLLKFAEIHHKHWKTAVERSVLASVRAFHFLHRVRFGGLPETVRSDLDPDCNDSRSDNEEEGARPKRLSRNDTTQDCADLNTLTVESSEAPCTYKKVCRRPAGRAANAATVRTAALLSTPNDAGGLTPPTCPGPVGSARNNCRHAAARQKNFKRSTTQARTIVRTNPPGAPALRAEPSRPNGRQRPTQTCWERPTIMITRAAESNPNDSGTKLQTTERVQPAILELPLAVLWARWRQAEPRLDRRSTAVAAALRHRPIFKRKPSRGCGKGRGEGLEGPQ